MRGTKAYLDEEWSAHAWPRGAVNPRAGLDYLSHECVACSLFPSWEGRHGREDKGGEDCGEEHGLEALLVNTVPRYLTKFPRGHVIMVLELYVVAKHNTINTSTQGRVVVGD